MSLSDSFTVFSAETYQNILAKILDIIGDPCESLTRGIGKTQILQT